MLQNLQNKQNNVMKIIILFDFLSFLPLLHTFFKVKINLFEFILYARLYVSFKYKASYDWCLFW